MGSCQRFVVSVSIAVSLILVAGGAAQAEKVVPPSKAQLEFSYAPLVKKVAPAVVNIYARRVVGQNRSPFFEDPFFRRFFSDEFGFERRGSRIQNALGSGVIIRKDGLIVTNNHVVKGADEIIIALSDHREFAAEVVLSDQRTDLAVLKVDAAGVDLPSIEFRDSDELEVGDIVLAIGNPFGVGQTVTSGIVSALARNGVGVSDFQFFIQTDAAVNPGNSGGPLISMDGRIVGINTAIFSRSGGSNGIGFAIPANMVRAVVHGAMTAGKVVRPWLGAAGQQVTREIATSLGLEAPLGVLVNEVVANGPASRAGLEVGDVIVKAGGRIVDDAPALMFRIATRPIGGTLDLEVRRGDEIKVLTVELQPAPELPPREVTSLEGGHPIAGATVGNLSPAFAEELGVTATTAGVIVLNIIRGSPAHRLRLRPGDILLSINAKEINTVNDLQSALQISAGEWRISLRRGNNKINLVVRG
jgi:serine protease Do